MENVSYLKASIETELRMLLSKYALHILTYRLKYKGFIHAFRLLLAEIKSFY